MKIFTLLLICFCLAFVKDAYSQNIKSDTAYYFIDTTNTPIKERMWDIGVEGNSKYFTIQCACLQYGQNPTFTYRKNLNGQVISAETFNKLNTIDLVTLIKVAKQFAEGKESKYSTIMFISKEKGLYKMYRMNVLQARKPYRAEDYITIKGARDSTKK